jgi:predicted ArsR family transcriptional regulator
VSPDTQYGINPTLRFLVNNETISAAAKIVGVLEAYTGLSFEEIAARINLSHDVVRKHCLWLQDRGLLSKSTEGGTR